MTVWADGSIYIGSQDAKVYKIRRGFALRVKRFNIRKMALAPEVEIALLAGREWASWGLGDTGGLG